MQTQLLDETIAALGKTLLTASDSFEKEAMTASLQISHTDLMYFAKQISQSATCYWPG